MQSHILYIIFPVDVIEGDLNSLSSGTNRFEDLPNLAHLLFDDATGSSIAARYSDAVQNCENLLWNSARVQVISDEGLNGSQPAASKESGNTGDGMSPSSGDYGFWSFRRSRRRVWIK